MSRLSVFKYLPNFKAAFHNGAFAAKMLAWVNMILPPPERCGIVEDFLGIPGAALPLWLTTQDTSAAGAPTFDYVADASGGVWAMKLAADNEVEAITLYQGDQLTWDIAKDPILRFRVKIEPDVTGAGGVFAAGDKLVMGFASNRNATLDSVVTNAWFMLAGANMNIYCEADNGTADVDDKDTGIDYVADTWLDLEIDATNHADVRFRINGIDRTPATFVFAIPSTGSLQFFAELQKAAAANMDHRVSFDFLFPDQSRAA